jgi:hypothetical protein
MADLLGLTLLFLATVGAALGLQAACRSIDAAGCPMRISAIADGCFSLIADAISV